MAAPGPRRGRCCSAVRAWRRPWSGARRTRRCSTTTSARSWTRASRSRRASGVAKERARRRVTIAAGALAAVFLVLAGLAGLQWLSAESERRTAEEQRAAAEDARGEADAARGGGRGPAAHRGRAAGARRRRRGRRPTGSARGGARAGGRVPGAGCGAPTATGRCCWRWRRCTGARMRPRCGRCCCEQLTAEPRLVRFAGARARRCRWVDVRSDADARWRGWTSAGTVRVADLDDHRHASCWRRRLPARRHGRGRGALARRHAGRGVGRPRGGAVGRGDTGEQRWPTTVPGSPSVVRLAFVAGATPGAGGRRQRRLGAPAGPAPPAPCCADRAAGDAAGRPTDLLTRSRSPSTTTAPAARAASRTAPSASGAPSRGRRSCPPFKRPPPAAAARRAAVRGDRTSPGRPSAVSSRSCSTMASAS